MSHGTKDDIAVFDLAHPRRKDKGWLGTGVYLTSNLDDANQYVRAKRGEAGRGEAGPNLMPLYANVRNPFEASPADKARLKRAGEQEIAAFTGDLKAKGHDGVVLWDEGGDAELVAFSPTDVKSAIGNNGDFDGTNAGVNFSRAAPRPAPATATWATPSLEDAKHRLAWDNIVYALQDKTIDVKRVQQAIAELGAQILNLFCESEAIS